MILKTLVENNSISTDLKNKHGICFYIETNNHKILFDLGKDGLFLENAKKMNVNISEIDIVVISHGHVDHGGALRLFLKENNIATVYIRENAFDKHYGSVLGIKFNVGIDEKLKNHPQIVFTKEVEKLDEELILFSAVELKTYLSTSNSNLFKEKNGGILKDDFDHEQSLIILENQKSILITGCSHAGIINIKNRAETIVNNTTYIIGGFHLYNPITKRTESNILIEEIARKLKGGCITYYTCHCTGKKAFNKMKDILLEQLNYLVVGSEIEL